MQQMKDQNEIERITSFFRNNKVIITKLNHSLDKSVQQFTQFDGYIQMQDNDDLIIMLKKPTSKIENGDDVVEQKPPNPRKREKATTKIT